MPGSRARRPSEGGLVPAGFLQLGRVKPPALPRAQVRRNGPWHDSMGIASTTHTANPAPGL